MWKNRDEVEKVYWSIGEVARKYTVAASLIRFWLDFFKIEVKKNRKGNRQFTKEDVLTIEGLYTLLKIQGRTMKGVMENFITLDCHGKGHLRREDDQQVELWIQALSEQNTEDRIKKFIIHRR